MNAVANFETYDDERYALKGLEYELNAWGRWIERHYSYEGYPSADILESARTGRGTAHPGHRILCLDMPTGIYATHARVLRLPEAENEAIRLRYCVKLKDDGTLWSEAEVLLIAKIDKESFQRRIARAKRRILGLSVT